ncbi:hypothetical protein EB796_016055 [Bugula neritina]|uniref:Uncharacterized protein n=1 Tax=Bugula neritina TaxID=10212 RepID=A0A7J7JJL5_BUGNE|nr:hypothetical protein EB796_016055 [Bugula neritina]
MLTDEIESSTECVLMYVAEDGKHMCIYVGPFSTQYVLQHRLQEQWASLESDKNRVSEFDLVYQCQHCAFSSGYLHNMKLHHLNTHPQYHLLGSKAKWSKYKKSSQKI